MIWSENILYSSYYLKGYLAVKLTEKLTGETDAVSLKVQSYSQ